MIGKEAEKPGMSRKIMGWIEVLHQCIVPRMSLIVRKSYGMAHCNMSGGNMGNDRPVAGLNLIDKIIDLRETRHELIKAFHLA